MKFLKVLLFLNLLFISTLSIANKKVALIFGITGQDGAYLTEFLLSKGYIVHGVKRRSSSFNTGRIDHIYKDIHDSSTNLILHYGDVTDSTNVISIVQQTMPDEIYNLAAQSHVQVSFETPEYTANSDALGTLRILEAIKILGLTQKTKFYQASTSELYGEVKDRNPQNENTIFNPVSPYAVAKNYGFYITKAYRKAYGIFACNGILFNHESPLRGETFVTKKITRAVSRIKYGLEDKLYLGNLDSYRDWGYAKDYVEAMWLILQQNNPDDFVIATGENHTVREFVEESFKEIGIEIEWQGKGIDEKGIDKNNGKILVVIDHRYFRPNEVGFLLGDASKAKNVLGWQPRVTFKELVKIMMQYDLEQTKKYISAKNNNK